MHINFKTYEKILQKISAFPVPFHAGLKFDLHTLHLGYVSPPCGQMDSILNVLSRATRIRKFVLLKMPSVGKCNFNSDWVLDGAYKDWFHAVKGDKHTIANCAAKSLN